MKKKIFFQVLLFGVLQNCYSQDVKQNVIASAGGIAKTYSISFEWTLGEFAVESIVTAKNLYTQGFHQPLLMVKSINSPPKPELADVSSGYRVLLAPNPAQSFVNVYIGAKKDEKFSLSLFDMSGKKIGSKEVSGNDLSVRFEMGGFASSIYLMQVQNDAGTMLRTFKILKAD